MKVVLALPLLSALIGPAFAQAAWNSLILNGAPTGVFQYVRQYSGYVTDIASTNMRCGPGGLTSQASTATLPAGSTTGFVLSQPITGPGVINVYMAKAPSTAASFDGSGAVWFKVAQLSAITNGGSSITFPATGISQFNFKIPSCLPSGEYLARIEFIALRAASSYPGAQFNIACANLRVTGGGAGSPSPKVAIPGVYTASDPGITINIYYPIPPTYPQPGPPVWNC